MTMFSVTLATSLQPGCSSIVIWGGKGLAKFKKSNFQFPKGPCGHDTRNKGLDKFKKSNFQLPKGPCGHDIGSTGLEKPFKISSRQLKMEKCFFMNKWNLYWKTHNQIKLFDENPIKR